MKKLYYIKVTLSEEEYQTGGYQYWKDAIEFTKVHARRIGYCLCKLKKLNLCCCSFVSENVVSRSLIFYSDEYIDDETKCMLYLNGVSIIDRKLIQLD